jgi:5-methyltetrahydrofolate--homocysteine methyltransferase
MEPVLNKIYEGILEGQVKVVTENVQSALETGMPPSQILNEGMIVAMAEVGERFENGDYFVPEMLISARAMQSGLALLKPYLKQVGVKPAGKVVIGTVKGDLHDIGKNLVAMMLEGAGFEIIDLGADVTPEKFVDVVCNGDVQVVGLSALLTTTMPNMETVIKALKNAGLRDKVKVIVGGAPVTETYANQIEADGYSPDASRAVNLVKSLLNGSN